MILHKRSFAPEIASAPLPPPKVLLREVDHSNALRTQVYGLRNSLYHQVANFNILEGRFRQKESGLSNLEAQIRNKDVVITEQAQLLSQLRQGLEEARLKDATIVQQSQALQKLQRDLGEVRDHVLLEAKAEIQWLQVDRESEILALNDKYEMTLRQLQESPSVAQEERDQEQSEAPASVSLNPSNHTLREMNTDPPLTSSTQRLLPQRLLPPQRLLGEVARKNQESRKEIETEKQRIQNLAHVRDLFKTAFKVTQDEDFLQCGGASSQVTKVFVQGNGPGPDPSHLQNWTIETRSDEYWTGKIKQKFARIKRRFDRAKPRVRDDLSVETNAEVAARPMVAVKEAKGDDDVVAWQFLHSVITKLGSGRHSSNKGSIGSVSTLGVRNRRQNDWKGGIRGGIREDSPYLLNFLFIRQYPIHTLGSIQGPSRRSTQFLVHKILIECDVFFFPFYAKEAFGTTRASVGGMRTSYSITVNPATPSNFPLPSYQNRVQRLALHEIGGVLIVLFLHLLSTAENRIRCSGYALVSQ
ncbi:hypothetical protein F5141DRAFT_1069839 [Pisolithus sp. B1]|nr:hypothetical protein F5141DRAFT_1069839 [Pisolithus sp. B1]